MTRSSLTLRVGIMRPYSRLSRKAPMNFESAQPLWQPSAERIAAANITRFARFVAERFGVEAPDYNSLWQWSVARRDEFWLAVWEFCNVVASRRGECVVIDGDQMPGAFWFPDARLNFAENLLAPRHNRPNQPAIIFGMNWAGRRNSRSRNFTTRRPDLPPRCAEWDCDPATVWPRCCRTCPRRLS